MSSAGLDRARAKMSDAGLDSVAIETFAHYYRLLEHGETGMIPESSIDPLDMEALADVEVDPEAASAALRTTAVIKLNGGLGTSMGMDRAKSLLGVRKGWSFLDILARQVLHLRREHDAPLPLIFMNSFRTSPDTMAALARYVDLPGEGTVGLITYMRTDSVNIADTALREIAELVKNDYGQAYALAEPRRYKTRSRNAQEAHEAVRPTSVLRTPDRVEGVLDRDQLRLYRLIWQRTVATQVADARFNQVGVDIEGLDGEVRYGLRATGQTLVFDGFIRIYKEGRDDQVDEDAETTLPDLTAEQLLRMLEVLPEQHFTQPPPRFSEASLVKTLEELGIGRPSTYASIISTIQDRGYVRLEEKRFYPEDVGMVVTDKLIEHFPDVVDVHFTAHMEDELDNIAEGGIDWTQVLHEFNGPFERALEKAEHSFERYEEVPAHLADKVVAAARDAEEVKA